MLDASSVSHECSEQNNLEGCAISELEALDQSAELGNVEVHLAQVLQSLQLFILERNAALTQTDHREDARKQFDGDFIGIALANHLASFYF